MQGLKARLSLWLLLGEWRAHPVRALVAVAAIAIGVGLGFAIHLINAAAFNEFSSAIKNLSGQADVQVGSREARFDETIYPWLAQRAGVALASPVLELDAGLPRTQERTERQGQRDQHRSLKIIGLDALRAGAIAPDLIGAPTDGKPSDVLADDALFLSPAAMAWLNTAPGARLTLRAGTGDIALRVAGGLQRARAGQRIGVMDLGAAQWRFGRLGQLSRIDLKLREGIDRNLFEAALARDLERDFPGVFLVSQPGDEDQSSRNANLSRAYRVNLTVLALVALFTGAFLVFSTQALSVLRRRSQFALLRVLGLERRQLLRHVLLEGASLGMLGSALGIAGGYGLAALALHVFGGDLGAGYFSGATPQLQFAPLAAGAFFLLGFAVALLGALAPAHEAARAAPAAALKSGSEEAAMAKLARIWPALACIAAAALMTQAAPVFGLPLFGYLSVALLLIGTIALMPRLASWVFRWLDAFWQRSGRRSGRRLPAVPALTLARLANAPGQAAIALGGVLSSFSLMVAMAIMVSSFRVSVDDWLRQILPAQLYVRSAAGGDTGGINPGEQAALVGLPGIARIDFLRTRPLALAPDRPSVTLLARPIAAHDPGQTMVLVGATAQPPAGSALAPIWVSEAVVDLYGVHAGGRFQLPLGGKLHEFFIAGVWRDYARQSGAIQMRLSDYRSLTGDLDVSDAALWLHDGVTLAQAEARINRLPFGATLELAQPGEIRAISLKIFDRSFAVTYVLEAIAILIGLFGVAATFSAQTLARAKEFGMLRHIGVTRGQILGVLALEGGALTALGIASGFGVGFVISLILVFIVNPQSFHWTMQLHMPWPLLAGVAALLLAASALTALLAGRYALSGGPIRAVREDW
jgi:putative ABC transport system permease protein